MGESSRQRESAFAESGIHAPAWLTDRVGPFRLVRCISAGGMGVVFEGCREQPHQQVAIKLLKNVLGSETQLRRFEAETRFLAALNHPNVAKVFDAGIELSDAGPIPYLVMEFIDGATPITTYAAKLNLSVQERLELFIRVCDAVAHGHSNNILHRDLKPSNIVVDSHGIVKVIDFGVAKAIESDAMQHPPRTLTGEIVGTMQYMSPEQLTSESDSLDGRSDVYSLGIILYELVTGELPYRLEHLSTMAAMRAVFDAIPRLPTKYVPNMSRELEGILLKSIARHRTERYQSASDLKSDLMRFLNDEPIAGPSTIFYKSRRIGRRIVSRNLLLSVMTALIVAFSATEFIGVPLIYKWLPVQEWYMNWLSAQTWIHSPLAGLEHVRVIRITDETAEDSSFLAEEAGIDSFDPSEWKSMRALHGHLLAKLVDSEARVVALDFYFIQESQFDSDFIAGIHSLHAAGIPTVVATPNWCIADGQNRPVVDSVGSVAQWGCASVTFVDEVELVLDRRHGPTSSSFALTVAAAYWQPNWDFIAAFDPADDSVLQIDLVERQENSRTAHTIQSESRRIPLTSNSAAEFDDPDFCVKTGDFSGYYSFPLPPANVLEESSVDYESVFRADGATLAKMFSGNAVLIGDYRAGKDVHAAGDGSEMHGCSIHAAAIESLLNNIVILKERSWLSRAGILLLAIIGVGAGMMFANRPKIRMIVLGCLAVILCAAALLSYSEMLYIFNPLLPFIAALIGCELVAKIISTHRSYAL